MSPERINKYIQYVDVNTYIEIVKLLKVYQLLAIMFISSQPLH